MKSNVEERSEDLHEKLEYKLKTDGSCTYNRAGFPSFTAGTFAARSTLRRKNPVVTNCEANFSAFRSTWRTKQLQDVQKLQRNGLHVSFNRSWTGPYHWSLRARLPGGC